MTKTLSRRAVLLPVFVLCFAAHAGAQSAAPTLSKSSANENYELRIARKRIVESPFERSANVSLANPERSGVSVSVGFSVFAQQSAISLRGVSGSVKLRASLAPIEAVLARHRAVFAAPVAPK